MLRTSRALVLGLTLLASCGGGDAKKTDTPSKSSAEATEEASDPVAQASLAPTPATEKRSTRSVVSPKAAAAEIAALVPTGALAYVQIASLDELESKVFGIAKVFDPSLKEPPRILDYLRMLPAVPFDAEQIDPSLPSAVAIDFSPSAGEPTLTFILPVVNPTLFIRSVELQPGMQKPLGKGHYVAVSTDPSYHPGALPSELVPESSRAAVALRLDMGAVEERFGSLWEAALESGMTEMRRGALERGENAQTLATQEALLGQFIEMAKGALADGELLELDFDVRGTTLDLALAYVAEEGTALAGVASHEEVDLLELAGSLDATATISGLVAMDERFVREYVAPYAVQMSAIYGVGDPMSPGTPMSEESIAAYAGAFQALFGTTVGFSGSLRLERSRFAIVYASPDVAAGVDFLEQAFAGASLEACGLSVSGPETSSLDGVDVSTYTIAFEERTLEEGVPSAEPSLDATDSEASAGAGNAALELVWGSRAIVVRFAGKDGKVLASVGGDETWFRRALASLSGGRESVPADLGAVLERVGSASPCYAVRVDAMAWAADVQELFTHLLALKMGADPSGFAAQMDFGPMRQSSLPMTFYGGAADRTWRFGMTSDLEKLGALMQAMK